MFSAHTDVKTRSQKQGQNVKDATHNISSSRNIGLFVLLRSFQTHDFALSFNPSSLKTKEKSYVMSWSRFGKDQRRTVSISHVRLELLVKRCLCFWHVRVEVFIERVLTELLLRTSAAPSSTTHTPTYATPTSSSDSATRRKVASSALLPTTCTTAENIVKY